MSNPRTLLESSDSSHSPQRGGRDSNHPSAWAPAGGHSRQSSADLRWTPYVPKTPKAPNSIFQAPPDQPCLSQPCFFGLNLCTVLTVTLAIVGIVTIIPPLVLTLGPQLEAHETYEGSSCYLISALILEIEKPCGGSGNSTTGGTRSARDMCPDYVPQLTVWYVPLLVNGSWANVTTFAYRTINDGPEGGGWKERNRAQSYVSSFTPGMFYGCWYDPKDPNTVVMDTTLDSIFWTGFAIAVAVFVFCIAVPIVMWCFVTARRLSYPDRAQLFFQNRVLCCCKKSRAEPPVHALPSDPPSDPILHPPFEKNSIEIPLPSFTSEEDKLHRV